MNHKCGSMNIEEKGDQRCELNNITALDVVDFLSWKSRPDWKFISSNYSGTAVSMMYSFLLFAMSQKHVATEEMYRAVDPSLSNLNCFQDDTSMLCSKSNF